MVVATPSKENLRQGPHRVEVEPTPRRVRVVFNGETIADSRRAVLLRESNLLPVYYFPPEDVRSDLLAPTEQHTRCPYKGEASYWTIRVGDKVSENSMWGYLDPLPGRERRPNQLAHELRAPGANRLLYVADALRAGWSLARVACGLS